MIPEIHIAYKWNVIDQVDCLSVGMIGTDLILVKQFADKHNYFFTTIQNCEEWPNL